MRLLALLACAACTADVPVDVLGDTPTVAPSVTLHGGGGIVAGRLGRHFGLAVGVNDRRLGDGWSLANPAAFDAGLGKLAPGIVRFPGGTIAQEYDWDGGTGATAGTAITTGTACPSGPIDPLRTLYQAYVPIMPSAADANADTLATLASELPAGASVDFELNTLMRTVYNQIQMLDAASARGLAIGRVELGNEFYYAPQYAADDHGCAVFAKAFPTAADYAKLVNAWAQKIAARYPNAELGVVANERFDDRSCDQHDDRFSCWNHDLLKTGLDSSIHALAIHPYVWHAGTCSGHDMYDDAPSLIGAAMQMSSALLATTRGADPSVGTLGYSLRDWDKPIWVTEYGYLNYSAPGKPDWRDKWAGAIGVLAYAIRLTTDSRITVLLHHNASDLIWPPGGAKQGLKARGIALAQLDRAIADAKPTPKNDVWWLDLGDTGQQYDVHAACGYDGSGAIAYHAVLGRWFTHDYDTNHAQGSSGLVVNTGDQDVTLDLAGLYTSAGADAEVWSAGPKDEPDEVASPPVHATVALDGAHHTVHVPAYGILRWHDRS